MNLKLVFVVALLLVFPFVSAAVTIEKNTNVPVIIADSDDMAPFTLRITNNGATDDFEIYSLTGVSILPRDKFRIVSGETREIMIYANPNSKIRNTIRGHLLAEYEVYSYSGGRTKDQLLFKIVDLKDVFDIRPVAILPDDEIIPIVIQNKENASFSDVKFSVDAGFVEGEKTISFEPYSSATIALPIDSNKIRSYEAGTYSADVSIEFNGTRDKTTASIKYLEKSGLSVSETSSGFIIRKRVSEKTNEGNVPVSAIIVQERNLLSRLLTTFTVEPANVSRERFTVSYTWNKVLAPAETLSVSSTTNYTIPFSILVIILAALILVKVYSMTNVVLSKRVSLVRTRGGEFALKVKLSVRARSGVENVAITDHVPHAMKLHDNFAVRPNVLDDKTRRIVWNLPRMHAGEERVFSYIIYSKMGVVGSYTLPLAHVTYIKNGKHHTLYSNKTSFAAESSENED